MRTCPKSSPQVMGKMRWPRLCESSCDVCSSTLEFRKRSLNYFLAAVAGLVVTPSRDTIERGVSESWGERHHLALCGRIVIGIHRTNKLDLHILQESQSTDSRDEGANCKGGKYVPEGPGSSPYVTSVGGTGPGETWPKPGADSEALGTLLGLLYVCLQIAWC
eukprot:5374534-Amphidinium_carterae.1